MQEHKLRQILNSSRSLSAIAPNSSVYVPIPSDARNEPPYLRVDRTAWQTSALQAAAIESYTLPSRLRPVDGRRFMLGDMEMAINRDGMRRIAELELSATDPSELSASTNNGTVQRDSRMTNGANDNFSDSKANTERYDIRLFGSRLGTQAHTVNGHANGRDHIFGRVESLRGDWKSPDEIEESNIAARDRFASSGDTTVLRYQTDLLFPILSSFPKVFDIRTSDQNGVAIRAALSTNTGVSKRLESLEQIVRRSIGISVDERTTVSEGLKTMAEEYVEGWDSDMGSDDDDL